MRGAAAARGASQIVGYGTLDDAVALLVPGMAVEFGVSQPWLFGVSSVGFLLGGLSAPRAGRLMDRHGAPRVMAAGSAAAGMPRIAPSARGPVGALPVLWLRAPPGAGGHLAPLV